MQGEVYPSGKKLIFSTSKERRCMVPKSFYPALLLLKKHTYAKENLLARLSLAGARPVPIGGG